MKIVGTTAHGEIAIHYDPRGVHPHATPGVNEVFTDRGSVISGHYRTVLVTVGGRYAGTLGFTPAESDWWPFCWGQRDQMVGVPCQSEEDAARYLAELFLPA